MDSTKDPASLTSDINILRKLITLTKEDIDLKIRCPTAEAKERAILIERYGDMKIKMRVDNKGFRKYYIDEWIWGPYKEIIRELFFFSFFEANRKNSCTCETKHIRKYTTKIIVHSEYFNYHDYFDIEVGINNDIYYEIDFTKNFGLEMITSDKKYAIILLNKEDILYKKKPSSKPRPDDMTDIPTLKGYEGVYMVIDRLFDKKKITKEIFDELRWKGCNLLISDLHVFMEEWFYKRQHRPPRYFHTFESFKFSYTQFIKKE